MDMGFLKNIDHLADMLRPWASAPDRSGPSEALLAFFPPVEALALGLAGATGEDCLDRFEEDLEAANEPFRSGSFAGGCVRFLYLDQTCLSL